VFVSAGSHITVNLFAFKILYVCLTEIACVGTELFGRLNIQIPLY